VVKITAEELVITRNGEGAFILIYRESI